MKNPPGLKFVHPVNIHRFYPAFLLVCLDTVVEEPFECGDR
jgi:hypothetical protein